MNDYLHTAEDTFDCSRLLSIWDCKGSCHHLPFEKSVLLFGLWNRLQHSNMPNACVSTSSFLFPVMIPLGMMARTRITFDTFISTPSTKIKYSKRNFENLRLCTKIHIFNLPRPLSSLASWTNTSRSDWSVTRHPFSHHPAIFSCFVVIDDSIDSFIHSGK